MDEIVTDIPNAITSVKQQRIKDSYQCTICNAPARYSYFGAIVCQSCKMFFKRNAETKQAIFKCPFDQHCVIDIHNRHRCSSCRLAKCFANGMCTEMIRFSRINKNRTRENKRTTTTSITTVEKNQPERIPTLNLLQLDQSTLSSDQWNLLSNLVHCFDQYSGCLFVERFFQDQDALPLNSYFECSSVKDFLTSMKGKIQFVFEKNRDLLSLTSQDRTNLLINTVKYTTSLGGMHILRMYHLLDYPSFYSSAEIIFRPNAVAFARRAINQLDPDDTFLKIVLAILSFSTMNYTVYTKSDPTDLQDIKKVLLIQDMYAETAWRYLLYKYGHYQTVMRFSNLIRCLFLVNDAMVEAHESEQFTQMIDSVIEQTGQILSL